jgi:hypothetical protein
MIGCTGSSWIFGTIVYAPNAAHIEDDGPAARCAIDPGDIAI